jgi:hypothetical protein
MVLGSPLLHALSGLARARLGWLCPRAWGGELVVRVSNRNVIAHCMRDKVHVTNSWQSSRICPVLMLLVLCMRWNSDAGRQISRDVCSWTARNL